jgi:hypothetical protein
MNQFDSPSLQQGTMQPAFPAGGGKKTFETRDTNIKPK